MLLPRSKRDGALGEEQGQDALHLGVGVPGGEAGWFKERATRRGGVGGFGMGLYFLWGLHLFLVT